MLEFVSGKLSEDSYSTMFKLFVFIAILAVAFAAPRPDPLTLTYNNGLSYSSIAQPILSSNLGYGYVPYASGYYNNYYSGLPYGNLYY